MEEPLELACDDLPILERLDERADVKDADDVVERLAIHGIPCVRRLEDLAQRLGGRQVDRQPDHVRPRHHHVRRLLLGEVEDLVEHLLLGRLYLPDILGGRHGVPDVLTREGDHPDGRRLDPHQTQHGVG